MSYLINQTSSFLQLGVFDEDRTVLWRPDFATQYRGLHLLQSASQGAGRWPSARFGCGNPATPVAMLGQDICQAGSWGPWELGMSGAGGPSVFLSGQTLDVNGTPLSGVTIMGFRTSDNLFVGQTVSDANGNYSLGSPYLGVAHYLEAYLSGSPDRAGTTVNTLIPA